MYKYYSVFVGLTVVVIVSIVYGFNFAGTPFSQKLLKEDLARLSDMSNVKNSIDQYYEENRMLPKTLEDLVPKQISKIPMDSKLQKPYEYKTVSTASYSLCTNFATDTKDQNSKEYQANPYNYENDNKHSKGYDCINYKIAPYLINTYTSPTPRKMETSSTTITGLINSIAQSETNPRIIVLDSNNIMRVVSLEKSEYYNQDGSKSTLSAFKINDRVIIDASSIPGNPTYLATRLQNLTQ